jgi:hypothetical protein
MIQSFNYTLKMLGKIFDTVFGILFLLCERRNTQKIFDVVVEIFSCVFLRSMHIKNSEETN